MRASSKNSLEGGRSSRRAFDFILGHGWGAAGGDIVMIRGVFAKGFCLLLNTACFDSSAVYCSVDKVIGGRLEGKSLP